VSKTLNDIMEIDHVIQVHEDGTVTDFPGNVHAPELRDEELSGDPRWEFFSDGYTGQHSYQGPIMHNSEFVGGGLERDILRSPGLYCAVVADWSPKCNKCDLAVTQDEHGAWIDDTDGDCCTEDNQPHEANDDNVEGWAVVRMDVVSLMKSPRLYMAGSYCTFADDGSGPDFEEHGWLNPSWSRRDLYENKSDVAPVDVYERDMYAEWEDEGERAYWLAAKVLEHIGYVDSVSGRVFYAADPDDEPTDPGTMSRQIIAEHFTDAEISKAVDYLNKRQDGYRVTIA
jgi:hypothetical protein